MRITEGIRYLSALWSSRRSSERYAEAAEVASTGKNVRTPKDRPADFGASVRITSEMTIHASRSDAAKRAQGTLELGETALADASDVLMRARALAVQMANGAIPASERTNAAAQIRDLRSALLSLANTRGPDGYLFGGTRTDAPPFDAAANFVANDNVIAIQVSDTVAVTGNASGASAFTALGGVDIFVELSNLEAALAGNNIAGVQAGIGRMDLSHAQLVAARVSTGLLVDRMASAREVMDNILVSLQKSEASLVEADVPTAYSALTNAQAAYERTLAVTRNILEIARRER